MNLRILGPESRCLAAARQPAPPLRLSAKYDCSLSYSQRRGTRSLVQPIPHRQGVKRPATSIRHSRNIVNAYASFQFKSWLIDRVLQALITPDHLDTALRSPIKYADQTAGSPIENPAGCQLKILAPHIEQVGVLLHTRR